MYFLECLIRRSEMYLLLRRRLDHCEPAPYRTCLDTQYKCELNVFYKRIGNRNCVVSCVLLSSSLIILKSKIYLLSRACQ